eukprot:COSAG05_NODE_4581_length_1452_cov_1.598670_2_plen_127_part_00
MLPGAPSAVGGPWPKQPFWRVGANAVNVWCNICRRADDGAAERQRIEARDAQDRLDDQRFMQQEYDEYVESRRDTTKRPISEAGKIPHTQGVLFRRQMRGDSSADLDFCTGDSSSSDLDFCIHISR